MTMWMKLGGLAVLALTLAVAGTAGGAGGPSTGAPASTRLAVVRIGVYDSRAVALAWGRNPKHMDELAAKAEEGRKAKDAGDQKKFQEISHWMEEHQFQMHAEVFSNAPATEALEALKAELPAIAKQAGVVAIVDRVALATDAVETVDVTAAMAERFDPSEQTRKYMAEMTKHPPASLYEATREGH